VPAVFVHGVPDTSVLWDPVLAELARDDTIALRLPGFGEPVPNGFGCTKADYAEWIVQQLRAIGEPVDLVGHDWGSILTQFVGSANPDLVRSWAASNGPIDADYVWHDMAQAWQTPEVGEQVMELMVGDAMVDGLREAGHHDPESCVTNIDERMKSAILVLYRSAVHVGAEWQPTVERNSRPALVLWGTHDPYVPADMARRLADRVHSRVEWLEGGHWAMFEHSQQTARALEAHWAQADDG
jgi:pimeloyl-ACP methyl ester carboxylesterase